MGTPSRLTAIVLGLLAAGGAAAQQPADTGPANPLGADSDLVSQTGQAGLIDGPVSAHLLGDPWGQRTRLHDRGIDIRSNFVSELAGNVSGGREKAVRAANEFNFGADLDLGKLGIDPGGAVHATFTQRFGSSLSKDAIGNLVSVQEIYGTGEDFRLTELSFSQSFLNQHVNISLGRVITESDFATSPLLWDHASIYCVFQNNGICGTPVGVPVNSGYDAYPQSTWGGRLRVAPSDTVFAQTGVYEVNPTLGNSANGLKISSSGATGAFVPVEIGWRPGHSIAGEPNSSGPLPGDYRLGAYYDTSRASDPFAGLAVTGGSHSGRYGFYVTAAQTVWRVPTGTKGGTRSLSVFGAVNVGDAATALYRVYAEAGVVLKGTFAGRDDDTVGIGMTDTEVNQRRAAQETALLAAGYAVPGPQIRELAFEVNYSASVYRGVNLEPGLQVVVHPNAVASSAAAWVLGLRTSVKF